MTKLVNHLDLYRLPWSIADNGISWLEPTAQCNLACDGCYRENRVEHKSFAETLHELDVFAKYRRSDALSIAGGDPLLYPDIIQTVAEAKRRGYKPVINTNGHAITPELVGDLKKAGLAGFTFHVDSKQGRPDKWEGKNEIELCDLRDELADLAARFDVGCAFNATVYPDTTQYVPALNQWAMERIDKVHVMVFILYRDAITKGFDYYNGHQKVQLGVSDDAETKIKRGKNTTGRDDITYNLDSEKTYSSYVTSDDVITAIRKDDPDFMPAAYLNGTEDPTTFKWLMSGRMGRPGKVHGYVGPKFWEVLQTTYHLFTNRYLAYTKPSACRSGKSTALMMAPVDKKLRKIGRKILADHVRNPIEALKNPVSFQTVLIIQPVDILEDGRMNMCDACPDITVHKDRLVWSCRMDEIERYGRNLWARPNEKETEVAQEAEMAEEMPPN